MEKLKKWWTRNKYTLFTRMIRYLKNVCTNNAIHFNLKGIQFEVNVGVRVIGNNIVMNVIFV